MHLLKLVVRFLQSMRLVLWLILALGAMCIIGTLIPGPGLARCLIYRAWWFELVVILLLLSLIACCIPKIGSKNLLRTTGFLGIHGGLAVVLVGGIVTALFSQRGGLGTFEDSFGVWWAKPGDTLDCVHLEKQDLKLSLSRLLRGAANASKPEVPLGVPVKVLSCNQEYYKAPLKLCWLGPDEAIRAAVSAVPGEILRVGTLRFRVKDLKETPGEESKTEEQARASAVVVNVDLAGQTVSGRLSPASPERFAAQMGGIIVAALRCSSRDLEGKLTRQLKAGSLHLLWIAREGHGWVLVPAEPGARYNPRGKLRFEVLRRFKNFKIKDGEPIDVEGGANPAIELKGTWDNIPLPRWVFAFFDGVHGQAQKSVRAWYRVLSLGKNKAAILALGNESARWFFKTSKGNVVEKSVAAGQRVEAPWGDVFSFSKRNVDLRDAPAKRHEITEKKLYRVFVQDEQTGEKFWLGQGDEKPIRARSGRSGILVLARGRASVRSYATVVEIPGEKQAPEVREIRVNRPLRVGRWWVYQARFQKPFTGLEAVYDPGYAVVRTGLFLMSIGVVLLLLVEPFLKRKRSND